MSKQKKSRSNPTGSQNDAQRISELMMEKKAIDIIIIDVRKITTLTDFFVVCTSESEPQTRAITDHINEKMKEAGIRSWHTEGYKYLEWVLIDFVNIVNIVLLGTYQDDADLNEDGMNNILDIILIVNIIQGE